MISLNIIKKVSKKKSAKAGMFYFIGNLFNKAIAFITIPIFTRLLTTSEYGIYSTYESWISILSVVVGLSIGNTIRNAYVDYKQELNEYISSIYALACLSLCVAAGAGILFGLFTGVNQVLILFCIIQSFMSNIITGYAIKYMMEVDYIRRMLLLALPNCISMLVSIVVISFMRQDRYMGRIIVEVLIYVIMGTCILIMVFKKGRMTIKREYWKYAFPLAWPLIFHGLSVNILSNSDRTMITYFCGEAETGIYGLIYSISMVASVITSALENIWIPWFTDKMIIGDKKSINNKVIFYVSVTILMICGIMLIAPEVLVLMAAPAYWKGKYMLAPLVSAYFFVFLYTIFVQIEYYYKKTKYIAVNTMLAGFLNIVLNFIFVPRFGAIAAAYTTLVSYMFSFLLHYRYSRKLDNDLFALKQFLLPIAICLIMLVLVSLFMEYWFIRWSIGVLMLAGFIFVMYKKGMLKNLL